MPVGHTVKVGDDWVDGFQVGRAAALSEWAIRKEIDDPEFKRLVWRLQNKRYRDQYTPEQIAAVRARQRAWRRANAEQNRATIRDAKRRGRKTGARWYEQEKARRRAARAADIAERRKQVHTCAVCGAQWCVGVGPLPRAHRPPKYCSQRCRSRANYERGKAAGAAWAKHDKTGARRGACSRCGGPCDSRSKMCRGCVSSKAGRRAK